MLDRSRCAVLVGLGAGWTLRGATHNTQRNSQQSNVAICNIAWPFKVNSLVVYLSLPQHALATHAHFQSKLQLPD